MIVSVLSYFITELFEVESINEHVMEHRLADMRRGREPVLVDRTVTVGENTFAVGKQIRDIFWPANLFVLSVKHPTADQAEVDEHGGKILRAGDELHVRYSTYTPEETEQALADIVGEL